MPEPVAFVSHFRVKPGKLDGLRALSGEVSERLKADKPRTLVFLAYLNESGTRVSFLHVFADAEALRLHVEGADERGKVAYEYVEPEGWEFYGRPGEPILEAMRQTAASAGVPLTVEPDFLGGFLRLGSS